MVTELFDGFADQVLDFDEAAAVEYSLILTQPEPHIGGGSLLALQRHDVEAAR
jgi:hypothetical protein